MIDFAAARRMMVDGQVRTSDVTDLRIIAAMLELPRERFVPEASVDLAYLDLDVPVAGATGGEQVRRRVTKHEESVRILFRENLQLYVVLERPP